MSTSVKPPVWFWVLSAFSLLWNLFGVFNYLYAAYEKEAILEPLNQAQRDLFLAIPSWAIACYATAVFSGSIASIALLLRKKWAKPLFIVSLLTAIPQFVNWLFIQKAPEVFPNSYIMPIVVTIIGVLLILFSSTGIKKGWLQ